MERIVDKLVALALGVVAAVVAGDGAEADAAAVVASLAAVLVAAAAELRSGGWWRLLPVGACAACLAWPPAVVWLPLMASDLAPLGWAWRLAPAVALVGCLGRAPGTLLAMSAVFVGIVEVLAWRTARSGAALEAYRELRDRLSATSQRLLAANADLAERREFEVRLATADERSRIAREIHDNAGHLLTRSLLQTQALAVAEPALAERLAPLAATLDEAMDTIRLSVHNLADEALDLEASLAALGEGTRLRVAVDHQASDVSPPVARAFIAIAREAVANTLRHSDAGSVRIAVAERPGLYQLTVHDDGSRPVATAGPAPAGWWATGRGMGLATIEERARALGGVSRLAFEGGFKVFVSVPRRATAEAGGAMAEAGGAVAETGGAVAETGRAVAEAGGAVAGAGGAVAETGGAVAETGGAVAEAGGAVAETGGAGGFGALDGIGVPG
ncbi:MAG: histidine kinase, partial [Bifidobacteriaceae bacterium]|nr:histidine kinase [Bifidobacteriaceae bacterium]